MGSSDDRRHWRMSARCHFRSIARGRAISAIPLDLGANISVISALLAVSLSAGVTLDIIGSDAGRRFDASQARAISHGCQPIHSWIFNRGTRTDPFVAYCLGHAGLICFEGTLPGASKLATQSDTAWNEKSALL
jgi:hypothetical protein